MTAAPPMRGVRPAPRRGQKFSRVCGCGCGTWATLIGYEDGMALVMGCDLSVRRWARRRSGAAG